MRVFLYFLSCMYLFLPSSLYLLIPLFIRPTAILLWNPSNPYITLKNYVIPVIFSFTLSCFNLLSQFHSCSFHITFTYPFCFHTSRQRQITWGFLLNLSTAEDYTGFSYQWGVLLKCDTNWLFIFRFIAFFIILVFYVLFEFLRILAFYFRFISFFSVAPSSTTFLGAVFVAGLFLTLSNGTILSFYTLNSQT